MRNHFHRFPAVTSCHLAMHYPAIKLARVSYSPVIFQCLKMSH